jgi:hypothetical protein
MSKLVCATAVLSLVVFAAAAMASDDTAFRPTGQFAVGTLHGVSTDASGSITSFVLITHETDSWPFYQFLRVDVSGDTKYLINKDPASWRDLRPGDRVVAHLECIPNSDASRASLVRIVSQSPPGLYCVAYTPPEPPMYPMYPEHDMWSPYGPMGPYYSPDGSYRMP